MRFLVCFVVAVLRLAGSEDLYWRPNTDWSNPNNWNGGRAPCEAQAADLSSVYTVPSRRSRFIHVCVHSQVPRGSVIQLDSSTTVREVILPLGSTIMLGRSISLRLSNSTTCQSKLLAS